MGVGLTSYDFEEKERYRTWTWNRIRERISGKPKDALVLYLAAAEDLDRPVALRKGFHPDNLIAVETDDNAVAALRAKRVNTIHADLVEVVRSWPRDWPINVVNADLTCGLTPKVRLLMDILVADYTIFPPGSVMAINIMRGREKNYSALKDCTGSICGKKTMGSRAVGKHARRLSFEDGNRNKALLFNLLCIFMNLHQAEGMTRSVSVLRRQMEGKAFYNEKRRGCDDELTGYTMRELKFMQIAYDALTRTMAAASAALYSYKSTAGSIYMDSIVFRIPSFPRRAYMMNYDNMIDALASLAKREGDEDGVGREDPPAYSVSVSRRIAAARAIRTMRLNGTLAKLEAA